MKTGDQRTEKKPREKSVLAKPINFRPTKTIEELLRSASEITGIPMATLIEESLREALTSVVDRLEAERRKQHERWKRGVSKSQVQPGE